MIDPTDDGGQACDRGSSYHSAVFVSNDEQRRIVERSEAALMAGPLKGGHIATYVRPAGPFWPAEDYHQHFADNNPVRYGAYRIGCGRDRILRVVWAGR
jgi:peptide-methionine (S)-S-oxide reductase